MGGRERDKTQKIETGLVKGRELRATGQMKGGVGWGRAKGGGEVGKGVRFQNLDFSIYVGRIGECPKKKTGGKGGVVWGKMGGTFEGPDVGGKNRPINRKAQRGASLWKNMARESIWVNGYCW